MACWPSSVDRCVYSGIHCLMWWLGWAKEEEQPAQRVAWLTITQNRTTTLGLCEKCFRCFALMEVTLRNDLSFNALRQRRYSVALTPKLANLPDFTRRFLFFIALSQFSSQGHNSPRFLTIYDQLSQKRWILAYVRDLHKLMPGRRIVTYSFLRPVRS